MPDRWVRDRRRAALVVLMYEALRGQRHRLLTAAPDDFRELYEACAGCVNATGGRVSPPARAGTPAELVTVGEAASAWGCSPQAVRKRITAGTVPARRYGGRWLLAADQVQAEARRRNGDDGA
jgi:hypothetical protein